MSRYPTPWQQFFYSGFKYRPTKELWNNRPVYKTNKAKWAKQ